MHIRDPYQRGGGFLKIRKLAPTELSPIYRQQLAGNYYVLRTASSCLHLLFRACSMKPIPLLAASDGQAESRPSSDIYLHLATYSNGGRKGQLLHASIYLGNGER